MEVFEGLFEEFPVEVRVDLGCGDAFMPEHFLHGPQICAAFYQVSGEGVTEGMR